MATDQDDSNNASESNSGPEPYSSDQCTTTVSSAVSSTDQHEAVARDSQYIQRAIEAQRTTMHLAEIIILIGDGFPAVNQTEEHQHNDTGEVNDEDHHEAIPGEGNWSAAASEE